MFWKNPRLTLSSFVLRSAFTDTRSSPTLRSERCTFFSSSYYLLYIETVADRSAIFCSRPCRYDQAGEAGLANGGGGGGMDASDLFSQMFGGGGVRLNPLLYRFSFCQQLKLTFLPFDLRVLSSEEEDSPDKDVVKDLAKERISFTESTSRSPISTRGRSPSSLFRSTSSARVARVEVERRDPSRRARLAEVRDSGSC